MPQKQNISDKIHSLSNKFYKKNTKVTNFSCFLQIECCTEYIRIMRNNGDYISARKCFDRLLSFLEVLFYNPEVSNIVRENLIELQFQRAAELNQRTGQTELLEKTGRELKIYCGKRREEFQQKYFDLSHTLN